MFRVYVCVAMLAVMCHAVIGQEQEDFPDEWEPSLLPNPLRNPEQCGISKSGFVCDPNNILDQRTVELLDWLLRGFYDNDTLCPCSTYSCETTRKGSHLSVAIVRKMKLADTFEDPDVAVMQSASNFALQLARKQWTFGQCKNNIVIFYSQQDGVLFISYGATIGYYLSNPEVDNIQRRFGPEFRPGGDLSEGLVEIILALRQSLNGYKFYDPNNPHFEQLVGGADHMTSGVVASLTLALLSTIWSLQ